MKGSARAICLITLIEFFSLICDHNARTLMGVGSLQGVKVIHRTKELEEKQAKRCNNLTFITYFLNFWMQIVFRSLKSLFCRVACITHFFSVAAGYGVRPGYRVSSFAHATTSSL